MTYKMQAPGSGQAGTARLKRARHGCERDWNRLGEPFARFIGKRNWWKTTREWLRRRRGDAPRAQET